MPEIAQIKLNSALKDAVDAMLHGTGLTSKDNGDSIEIIDFNQQHWGEVTLAGTDEEGNQLYKYDSTVHGDDITGTFDVVTNYIHDDMAECWDYQEVPKGVFRESMENIDPKLRKALVEAYHLCHKCARLESESSSSKKKWINRIYVAAEPYTKGLKRDNNWENVWQLFDVIKKAVPEVSFDVGTTDGGYVTNSDGMKSKVYNITGQTPEGFPINGQLVCSFCGPSDDPESCYDMSLILN